MNRRTFDRRQFLRLAGTGIAATAAGCTDGGGGDDDGGGGEEEVIVGPEGEFVFEPERLTIPPGTTVTFTWESDTHNIAVESQPDDANWEGHEDIEDEGFEHEHTFEVVGEYDYVCEPHEAQGMVGTIVVEEE